jgi:hypothetical protein
MEWPFCATKAHGSRLRQTLLLLCHRSTFEDDNGITSQVREDSLPQLSLPTNVLNVLIAVLPARLKSVSMDLSCSTIALYVDGQRIALHPSLPLQGDRRLLSSLTNDLERCSHTQSCQDTPPAFALGYPGVARMDVDSKDEWSQMWLVLHEFRIWCCNVDEHVITR